MILILDAAHRKYYLECVTNRLPTVTRFMPKLESSVSSPLPLELLAFSFKKRNFFGRTFLLGIHKHCMNSIFFVFTVRYIRGYREQHEKQAVPLDKMEEFRATPLSSNTETPYKVSEYSQEELQTARRYRYVYHLF